MNFFLHKISSIFLICLFSFSNAFAENLNFISLPKNFHIDIYADVPGARFMALGDNNIVFVGTRGDKVYALIPNADQTAAQTIVIAQNLDKPNGVAYFQKDLYVAEVRRILKYKNIIQNIDHIPQPIVVTNQLPEQRHHEYRVIHFSPDGWLYVSIGMPCNICNYRETQPLFGTIIKMRPDGRELQIFSSGIRNSMGFNWQPETQKLWFTDNGQDYLGDDLPPEEINYAPKSGMDFGFPYVYGDNVRTPQYQDFSDPLKFTPPKFHLPAHTAPLGLTFYTGKQFPEDYQQQMFIAEHGSWNRTQKIGYQIVTALVDHDKIVKVVPFATGWLQNKMVHGRPVDLLTMPDGSLLVSDDYGGKVYRITYLD